MKEVLEKLPKKEYGWKDEVKLAKERLERDKKMFGEADNGELTAMIENQTYSKGYNQALSEIKKSLLNKLEE